MPFPDWMSQSPCGNIFQLRVNKLPLALQEAAPVIHDRVESTSCKMFIIIHALSRLVTIKSPFSFFFFSDDDEDSRLKRGERSGCTYIQNLFVGFRWRGLSQNLDGYWDLHILSLWNPQALCEQNVLQLYLDHEKTTRLHGGCACVSTHATSNTVKNYMCCPTRTFLAALKTHKPGVQQKWQACSNNSSMISWCEKQTSVFLSSMLPDSDTYWCVSV